MFRLGGIFCLIAEVELLSNRVYNRSTDGTATVATAVGARDDA